MTGINRERNLVQVTYSFHTHKHDGREFSRTVTKEFSAADMPGKTALFREEERHLSAGGRIVPLKNDAGLDVQNGVDGTIRDIDQNVGRTPRPGRARGPHRPQELPAPGPRLCTHSSQEPGRHGETLDQHGIRIFTNSVEGLSRSVETVEEKSTTLQGRFMGNDRRLGEKTGELEPIRAGSRSGAGISVSGTVSGGEDRTGAEGGGK